MHNYEDRRFVLLGIFLLIGVVYLFRLFFIQVLDDSFTLSAKNQTLRHLTDYPTRGLIYDRNKKLLVYNEAAYDLMVIPKQIKKLDTAVFIELIGIEYTEFIEKLKKCKKYSTHKASVFVAQYTADEFSNIAENLYLFSGFYGAKKTFRKYPKASAAHVLGYVGEVNKGMMKRDSYYAKGDYAGITGLEKQYEKILRGKKGISVLMVDVHNIIQGSYKNHKYDTAAVSGLDIKISLDATLQNYGEKLMQNKKGSIVAIEPSTGEILAMVSTPNYDPNILVGRERTKNYLALSRNDSLDPLFNRALMAKYPPGSIYKVVQALIGMDEGVITENTGFQCNKSLVGCHNHPHPANITLAIQYSCNPYFYSTFKRIIQRGKSPSIFKDSELGLRIWKQHMRSFGFGEKLKIDFPNSKAGNIPGVKFYDRLYGHGRWAFSTIRSISIGQGEVEVIPLQMANLAATIANRGWYITPHFIKTIENTDTLNQEYITKHKTMISPHLFDVVVNAMELVVDGLHGTARRAKIDSIIVCGKTGTAENPHGADHSVFMAFAPRDNPKIAMVVYVENAGFGGTWAAPIASLMIEKYITGEVKQHKKEKRILEANLMDVKAKSKK